MTTDKPSRGDNWLQGRTAYWQQIDADLVQLEDRKPISIDTLRKAVRNYPDLARDVAIARREAPRSRISRHLETVYTRMHRSLFRAPRATREDVWYFLRREIPEIVGGLRWQIFSVTLGFVLAALAGWWLVWTFPELAGLFASQAMIDGVQRGELWTDGIINIMPSSLISVRIFTNNIIVSLSAVCLGALYGLGTFYIIGLNGLMLGGIFALTGEYGMSGELFEFVVAHGLVELSVIFIAGAVGFSVGESLARPGHRTRAAAFQRAVLRGAKLMLVCLVFLVGAGLIEGYISPNPAYSLTVRLLVGFAYWLVFLFVLSGPRLARLSRRDDQLVATRDVAA
jgi:uncharacterized membrane protein SpoIIM required for sporulation